MLKYNCPECDTVMDLNESQDKLKCPDCGHSLLVNEAERMFDQGSIVGVLDEDADKKSTKKAPVTEDFEGYANRSTWGAALMLENEYPLYKKALRIVKEGKDITSGIKDLFGGIEDINVSDVNWDQIVADVKELHEEAKQISSDLIEALSGQEELDEETKTEIVTIFESAVGSRIKSAQNALKVQNAKYLAEAKESIRESVISEVDGFLDTIIAEWVEENKIALENGIRTEMTESFIEGLYKLFAEHYVDVPEERFDVVEDLADKVASLENRLDESRLEKKKLQEAVETLQKAQILRDVSEGLAETQKEKLENLSASVDYESEEQYRKAVTTLKESFVHGKSTKVTVNETNDGLEQTATDAPITLASAAARILARTNRQ